MEHCGIDVHQKSSEICIVDDGGEVVETSRVRTTRVALERFFGMRARMRVALEAGGSSPWVSRLLASLGHEVIVCNPRRVRLIAESTLKNDAVDAEALARLVRLDPAFLSPVKHRSERAQAMRCMLHVRRAMVETRTRWICTVRALLRTFGYTVPGRGSTATFVDRVDQMELPEELRRIVEPLLEQMDLLTGEIERREKALAQVARELPEVAHLQEIPGVGPITALYFVLAIDDPSRFSRSRDIPAFFGLRPSMRESGGVVQRGRITKEGDQEMRRLLVQAAHAMMNSQTDCALKRWAVDLVARRGNGKATVALARKISVLMHHLWVTGAVFEAFPAPALAA